MAQTENLTITSSWQEVASGACVVTITATGPGCVYALREDAGTPPDSLSGHVVPHTEDLSLKLLSGTRLYVRGRASVLAYSVDDE